MIKKISLKNLTFSCEKNLILDNVSFDIENKQIISLLGANNSGKSVLLEKIINSKYHNKTRLIKYREHFFNENITVKEDIKRRSRIRVFTGNKKKKYKDLCSCFGINDFLNKKIKNLNSYYKKIVLLISALINDIDLLLLDDFFEDVTRKEYLDIINKIKELIKEYDFSVIFSTRKLDNCSDSNLILFLDEKQIKLSGNYDYMLQRDNLLARSGINISTILDLNLKLRFYDLVSEIIMDPERLVDYLWK